MRTQQICVSPQAFLNYKQNPLYLIEDHEERDYKRSKEPGFDLAGELNMKKEEIQKMRTDTESDFDFNASLMPVKTPSTKVKSTYFYENYKVHGREFRKRINRSKLRQSLKAGMKSSDQFNPMSRYSTQKSFGPNF